MWPFDAFVGLTSAAGIAAARDDAVAAQDFWWQPEPGSGRASRPLQRDALRRRQREACFLGQPSLGQNELRRARGAVKVCGRLCRTNIGSLIHWGRLRGCSAASYTAQSLALGQTSTRWDLRRRCVPGLVLGRRGDPEPNSKSATRTRENPCATDVFCSSSSRIAGLATVQEAFLRPPVPVLPLRTDAARWNRSR